MFVSDLTATITRIAPFQSRYECKVGSPEFGPWAYVATILLTISRELISLSVADDAKQIAPRSDLDIM